MPEQLEYQPATRNRRSIRRLLIRLLVGSAVALLLVWISLFIKQINLVMQMRRDMSGPTSASYSLKNPPGAAEGASGYVTFFYQKSGLKIYDRLVRCSTNAERILSVTASVDYQVGISRVAFHAATFTMPTIWPGSRRQFLQGSGLNIDADKVFAGQPDPNDPSHFTIKYELNDRTDIIDGWLMADDTVKIEPRGKFTASAAAPASLPSQKN